MFNLFRRRGRRSSKEEKQIKKNVAKLDEFNANHNNTTSTSTSTGIISENDQQFKSHSESQSQSQEPTFLKHGARASEQKVNLDSTVVKLRRQQKETPQKSSLNYHEYGDYRDGGVVVSENSTTSRTEGADPLGQRRSDNYDGSDLSSDQLKNQSNEKPAKRSKDKNQSSNRRSIFFRHFQTTPPAPSENSYHQLDEDHTEFINEKVPTIGTSSAASSSGKSSSKRFNPIEKGRELFNDILMAKGRHRNHRSHHHKNGGSVGAQIAPKANQDPKKDYDLSKKTNPEASRVQHTYQISQKSKNTHGQQKQTADGAAAAAHESVVSAVSSVKCADSSDINNSINAQTPATAAAATEEKRTDEDVKNNESSSGNQTVSERASIQVHRENASASEDLQKIVALEKEREANQKRLECDRVTASLNVGDLQNLSELTECDRDRFIVETKNTEEMGQSQAKSEPTTEAIPKSRSSSPSIREFRESHVADDKFQQSPPIIITTAAAIELIVPKIVVEDFGIAASSAGTPSEKGEIFYDSENNRSAPEPKIEDHLLKVPDEDDQEPEEDDADDDEEYEEEEDQWHFVKNLMHRDDDEGKSSVAGESATNYQKAENSSDSNLSNSDSGIATSASENVPKVLLLESCDLLNDRSKDSTPNRLRDGNSTDCDENLPLCDEFDYYKDLPTIVDSVEVVSADDSHSGILIESISLPDVVVESTSAQSVLKNNSSDSVNGSNDHRAGHNNEEENVDNSENVKMGNVHFIPIRVEKRRSIDDSVLMTKSANGGNLLYNGQQYNDEKPTLVITSEDDENTEDQAAKNTAESAAAAAAVAAEEEEKHKRELVDQETHFNAQLDDAQKNIYNLQSKVTELQSKIDDLERELAAKTWNVERLQGELGAAHKEDEFVRKKLKLLEDEKTTLRQKSFETEEDLQRKYDDLERQYNELDERYKEMKSLAGKLQLQLACAQSEAEQCQKDSEELRQEKDEQVRILEEALATAKEEQEALQTKWHKEFESLRTQNADREESLMSDCEWQLRQMQKSCKDKIDKAEHLRKEAVAKNERVQQEAEEKLHEVEHLRSYEAEVKQLRGLTNEQENSITSMREQIEELKADLVTANENLEEQIECVRKIKYQCNNALYDKEREMLQKIDDVRNEAASLWENKLITEMTRLKMELESVYVDERREELDKLQAEHIEELKALTSRYTANEEELRAEIAQLRSSLQQRNEEYANLREKSDNAILQTRMHLDRADRDYQTAMCREEEKREQLTESLRKELEAEKNEMEEKFRERLGQVQDEFNKELQTSTQEMQEKHKKEMEQQWQRLIAEKEEAIHELEARNKKKIEDVEDRLHDAETRHQHNLKDLKLMYDSEKASLDKRDMNNANEIEQLHRKCRCLTNLFEEMRMRYERRDPRQEDLREIAELRSRCEAQERDIFALTDRLREMQIQLEELQGGAGGKKKSQVRKPPPKTIPTNCDVIYEENEERESPPPPPPRPMTSPNGHLHGEADDEDEDDDDDDDEEDEDDDEEEKEEEEEEESESTPYKKNTINDDDHPSTIISNKKTNSLNLINQPIV
ncbi:putative leucine-rich repeat-containing protein DDB_G0290503 isoform X2 [Eupeodes corollae]|uniref:putative leucine-rich repeat-containing protein DDB_G0290503 isoform X2 n=1 Tax=Eupeodes corollae TaxID=290404 RepID=UPI002492AB77|nr:putative leucine-rich repeat-containing protein DDB_G0290503 isoform X2 [Eupeodes corollae]